MKNLILSALLMLSLSGFAQQKTEYPIAKETYVKELKSGVRINTSNEKVFKAVCSKFTAVIKGYSVKNKTDRAGEYLEYSIPFKTENANQVIEFIKNLQQ